MLIDHVSNLPFIEKINYSRWVNIETGQIFVTHTFNLEGLVFYWDDFKLTIIIKPHYYHNNNVHNANDFTPSQCVKTLNGIAQRLELQHALKRLKIVGLEYGVNFVTPYSDVEIVNAVYYHSTNQFYNNKDLAYSKVSYKPRPDGKANQHKQYKFYSKAIQHPTHCQPNTLRAEIKSNRSAFIKQRGINSLNDLLILENYNALRSSLIKETKQLLFIHEQGNLKGLTRKQIAKAKRMSNPIYWQKLLKNNRSKFARKKREYFNISNRTYLNYTDAVITGVDNKLKELFEMKSGLISSIPLTNKSGLTSTYSIGRDCTTSKVCILTGLDISMQRPSSKYLSITGLKFLEINDLPTFLILKKSLLTGHVNKFEKDIYSKMSKQIRNRGGSRPPVDRNQFGISF